MQIIFLDPYSSLNPRKPISDSIMAELSIHKIGTRKERQAAVMESLHKVGLEEYHARRAHMSSVAASDNVLVSPGQ